MAQLEEVLNFDRDTCPHPHELLISVIEEHHLEPTLVLHHWDFAHTGTSASTATSQSIPSKLGHEDLELIHGFQDLGIFYFNALDVSGPHGLHRYLTRIIIDGNGNSFPPSSDVDTISSIVSHLRRSSNSSQQDGSVKVHLFSIRVMSNTATSLFTGGSYPAWKWTRSPSNSIYKHLQRRQGFWKPDLEDVVSDGKEAVGAGLRLLVQGISEDRKEELRRRMVIFPGCG
jgi:hypothetical protein